MNNIIRISIVILLSLYSIFSQAQNTTLPCVEKSARQVMDNNFKSISNLLASEKGQIKILVLPFYDKQGGFNDISHNVAYSLSKGFQLKFQEKGQGNIVFITAKELDEKTGGGILKKLKSLEGDQEAYYKSLRKLCVPDYYIEGYYFINTKANQDKIFSLQNISLKKYFLNTEESLVKLQITDVNEPMTKDDMVSDAQSEGNIWANGTGSSYENANKKAMDNLMSKISSEMENKFMNLLSKEETDIKKLAEKIIQTYSNTAMQFSQTKIVSENPGKSEVIKYIKQDDLDKIFTLRKDKMIDMIKSAREAETKNQIGDALRYYYWSLALLRTLPDYDKVRSEVTAPDQILITALPDKISNVLRTIDITLKETVVNKEEDSKIMILDIKYNGNKVEKADYKYYTGKDYSPLNTSNNGTVTVEYFGEAGKILNNIKLMIEYEYLDKSKINFEMHNVLEITTMPSFSDAVKTIPLNKSKEKTEETQIKSSMTEEKTSPEKTDSVEVYKETINKVLNSIKTKNYAGIENCFTNEGMQLFNKLIKYGNARILPGQNELKIASYNNQTFVRAVPMRFDFSAKSGGSAFNENVVFTFSPDKKIDNISFALGETAMSDITSKSKWSDESKLQLVQFMENYKTAYALERIDYIESIFADNALIIVGKILKQAEPIEGMYAQIKNSNVQYIRMTKQEYITNLKNCFANNEFVNIQFEDNIVEKRDGNSEIYGIQIKQNYYSTNYADQGYLFLMIDLSNKAEPKIYVRSWQPEKNSDGFIMGLGDFTK